MLCYTNYTRRLTALDVALLNGHKDCADFLVSCHAPTGGGAYHRAACTIQAVWRFYRHKVTCSYIEQRFFHINLKYLVCAYSLVSRLSNENMGWPGYVAMCIHMKFPGFVQYS